MLWGGHRRIRLDDPLRPANEPRTAQVAARYGFDGDGWLYLDSGAGSDWQKRAAQHDDCEWLYDAPPVSEYERKVSQMKKDFPNGI